MACSSGAVLALEAAAAGLDIAKAAAYERTYVIDGARHVTLDGRDHGVLQQPDALRPLLTSYFGPGPE